MTIDEAIDLLDNLVNKETGEELTRLQKCIIGGVLQGWTYKQILENDPVAYGYQLCTLSKEVAYKLWKKLTKVLRQAGIIGQDEKVVAANLWDCIMRALQQGILSAKITDTMLGKLMLMRYRITEHLVSTEYSDTYLAEDENLPDRPFCLVKRLKSQSKKTSQMFDRETRVLYRLGHHDRIPELLARFEENGYFYLVYEFIEGPPISKELIEDKPWEEHQVIALLQDILEILVFVHKKNVIHRDIHPDNLIRRTSDGKIVLIDFGAVKEINNSQNCTDKTRSHSGTNRDYIPPEQAICSARLCSDIYAVGIIGIKALTGMRPRQHNLDDKGNLVWREKAKVSAQLAAVLDKMVLYVFSERYPSAVEALQALQEISQ